MYLCIARREYDTLVTYVTKVICVLVLIVKGYCGIS